MSSSESEVAQSCPILCDPMDCSLPGSSVRGIFQSRILEWVALSFYRRSSWPRDWTRVSRMVARRFTIWATMEVRWQVGINPRQVSAVSRYEVTAEPQSRAPYLLHAGHFIHSHKHTVELVKYSRKHVCWENKELELQASLPCPEGSRMSPQDERLLLSHKRR